MMNYDALPVLVRIVLMLGLFLILCGNICMMPFIFQRKPLSLKALALVSVLASGSIMILFSADVRSKKFSLDPSPASRWLCEKPILPIFLLFAAMSAFLICSVIREIRLHRTTLTRSAIKESIDHLPTGLCFYTENGRVMLANYRMNQLCHMMLGRDLQNAAQLWKELGKGMVQPGITPLATGSNPSFRLPDGTVWIFSREDLHGIFQITAADMTQFHELTEELEQKNIALAALYQRLKQYEENVEELTRSKERLETKARIHSGWGQTLLATRSYLLGGEDERQAPIDAWKRSIAMLRLEVEEGAGRYSLPMLVQTANAFGIMVEVTGQIPKQEAAKQLFLEAAAEALTNAVRHAGAGTLYIRFSETDTHYQASFQNDGRLPQSTIIEGGGLGSLRRKAETAGGSMNVCGKPEYTLSITTAKEGGESI